MQEALGDAFLVEGRFEQQKESYRMLQIEKWVTFLILSFILLIAVFNVVGSLSMLIVEKRKISEACSIWVLPTTWFPVFSCTRGG